MKIINIIMPVGLLFGCLFLMIIAIPGEKQQDAIVTRVVTSLTQEEKKSLKFQDTISGVAVVEAMLSDNTKTKALILKKDLSLVHFPLRTEIHSGGFCGCPNHIHEVK